MANIAAIRSVSSSLESFLNNSYRNLPFPDNVNKPTCNFIVVSSSALQQEQDPAEAAVKVLIWLYRVNLDPYLRNAGRPRDPDLRPVPLALDLHYMFTFWSTSAESEHLAVACLMEMLQANPILDATNLSQEAAWSEEEVVHFIPEELSNEDLLRIWDAMKPDFRLSVSYVARVVRIDPVDPKDEHPRVVATRFDLAVPGDSP